MFFKKLLRNFLKNMRLFKIYYGPDSYRDSRRMTYDTATKISKYTKPFAVQYI
jgi:hypothetical protein